MEKQQQNQQKEKTLNGKPKMELENSSNNEEGEESISRYGGQWWLNTTGAWDAPNDAFYAAGAGGQMTLVIPSKDMVIVRLTDYEGSPSTISKTQTQKAIRVIFDSIES